MKVKLLIAVAWIVLLVGCGEKQRLVVGETKGDTSVMVIQVEGKPLNCVLLSHGVSCNWEKHNAH